MNKEYLLIHRLLMVVVILTVIMVSFVATNKKTSANIEIHQLNKSVTFIESGIRD